MKSTLYITTTVLPGNKIEIPTPNLIVGQSVEIIVLIPENSASKSNLTLEQKRAFLKLPLSERRKILASQSESIVNHYQQDSEWKELMSGDIIDY
jgi:hypothetical protein